MPKISLKELAPIILRTALSLVFLWFGTQQLINSSAWVNFVPDFAISMSGLSALTLVHFNGAFEVLFGLCLITGFFTRASALVLGVHLLGISLSLGFSAIAIRDFGLSMATIAIFFYGIDKCTLDMLYLRHYKGTSNFS